MSRRAVLLRSVAILISLVVLNASGTRGNVSTNAGLCSQTYCKKGKMCVERKFDEVVTAECVCPTSCTNEYNPVCSVYHVEFTNLCELHRFACANEIHIRVKHQGNCTEEDFKAACTKPLIINFQDKYLQRLFRIFKADRVYSLVERLRLAKHNFDVYWDKNKNGLLEEDEITTILEENVHISKSCMKGFIKSCQSDGNPGISKQEWYTCFKTEAGQWRWSPWTDCSVSCGEGGRQRRTATVCILPSTGQRIEKRLCEGKKYETRTCSNGECPDWLGLTGSDGKWSRWSPWTDCSRSCEKGRQSRTRICKNKVTGKSLKNGWCAGKPQQEKSCADWKCPDPRKPKCPTEQEGTLNGRVLSVKGSPLAGANISLAESPYHILSRTKENGFFVVNAFCFGKVKSILITRHGYVPEVVNITNSNSALKIKMEAAVHPTVTSHPEDRMRFVGQDVTFCCQVEGNPPPVIEWFRNGNILDKDEFNNNETLVLGNVTKNMAGNFRCRAVNEFGAEFSEPVTLTIKDPVIDTCNSVPSDHFVTIPDGCQLEDGSGKRKVNIGKCENHPCLRDDTPLPVLCEEADRCCQPGIVNDITVRCSHGGFKMKKVMSCRCDVCQKGDTIVRGVVVGGPDERPVEYCDILVNDTIVAYSDYDGTFEIPVPKSAKRLVATFRDYLEEYEESTVVLPFRKGTITFHKVHLRLEGKPIEFDAEEEIASADCE